MPSPPFVTQRKDEVSPIAEFYHGKNVFITGATGFIGKVLVEKLLRSCSGVKNIYILIRSKKGKEPSQRVEELLNAKIFEQVRTSNPTCLSKVVPIVGDITLPDLGINNSDRATLIENVSIVFHSAATVRFEEPLKKAVDMNILGTRRIIQLCHKMSLLEALIHVSTAYCNCNQKEIEEIVYPPPVDPQKLIDTVTWMNESLVDDITPKLLGDRPNTYTFTKALAETLLVEECGSLPVAIVRPSIVTGSWNEPLLGWADNFNGPAGMIVATGKGLLRSMMCESSKISDLIPVDVVINLMITVAWHTSIHRHNELKVYNCASSSINPVTWKSWEMYVLPALRKYPSGQIFRYPGGTFKTNHQWNSVCQFFQHHIPAHAMDILAKLSGQKPKMVWLYSKIHRAVNSLEYFTMREWIFHCNNVLNLANHQIGQDKKIFNFSLKTLHWPTYFENYVYGVRKYLLKEEEATLSVARTNLARRYWIGQTVNSTLILFLLRLVFTRSVIVQDLWYFLLALVKRSPVSRLQSKRSKI